MCNRMKPQPESNPMAYDMTLRDQFAASALAALIGRTFKQDYSMEEVVDQAYEYADLMLSAKEAFEDGGA